MRASLVFSILLLLNVSLGIVQDNTCSYTDSSGNVFDLSALTYDDTLESPMGYSYTASDGNTYFINFCEPVTLTLSDCATSDGTGSCQLSGDTYYPAGTVTSMEWVPFVRTLFHSLRKNLNSC